MSLESDISDKAKNREKQEDLFELMTNNNNNFHHPDFAFRNRNSFNYDNSWSMQEDQFRRSDPKKVSNDQFPNNSSQAPKIEEPEKLSIENNGPSQV